MNVTIDIPTKTLRRMLDLHAADSLQDKPVEVVALAHLESSVAREHFREPAPIDTPLYARAKRLDGRVARLESLMHAHKTGHEPYTPIAKP